MTTSVIGFVMPRIRSLLRYIQFTLVLGVGVLPAQAQDNPTIKLIVPENTIQLVGARCGRTCWLSALFAPATAREKTAAVEVTNLSAFRVTIYVKFLPSNGLAIAENSQYISVQDSTQRDLLKSGGSPDFDLGSGDEATLKLALDPSRLPPGLYTGRLQFLTKAPGVASVTQNTAVEIRVRDSVIWSLITVVLGILAGRLAQLIYDPKLTARMQLLDWLHELEAKARLLDPTRQTAIMSRLSALNLRLLSRECDTASLQTAFQSLENEIDASVAVPLPPTPASAASAIATDLPKTLVERFFLGLGGALRILAGVTPLPLPSVYAWLLPTFVLITLLALTVTFTVQQYGGSGSAETFGAGGIVDYATLFLGGVASDAIAGGLRAIKIR